MAQLCPLTQQVPAGAPGGVLHPAWQEPPLLAHAGLLGVVSMLLGIQGEQLPGLTPSWQQVRLCVPATRPDPSPHIVVLVSVYGEQVLPQPPLVEQLELTTHEDPLQT